MILIKILIIFYLFSSPLNANNIATINISKILNSNMEYINFINKLEDKKRSIELEIKNKENLLIDDEVYIANNQYILKKDELSEYTESLKAKYITLQNFIEKYNFYFDKNKIINNEIIINHIVDITKFISIDKNIDIILNEENYFVSSQDIDITDIVINKLNNKKFKLQLLSEGEIFEN